MKYHKIRNVPKNVCTCEQKIAYNLAWAHNDCIKRGNFETYYDSIEFLFKMWKLSAGYKKGKYNDDAVFYALDNGFKKYVSAGCPILASYDDIGKMFPADEF